MSEFIILRADPQHALHISKIGSASFQNAFGDLFINEQELSDYLHHTYDPVKIGRSLRKENNIFFIAWYQGEAIGFAKVKKNSLNEQIESIAQMELQKIYVLPGYQHKGVGAALLDAVMDLANSIKPDVVWLDTHISNDRAIRFYEKNGFKKIGKHFFTIGTQTFEYHLMGIGIDVYNKIVIHN